MSEKEGLLDRSADQETATYPPQYQQQQPQQPQQPQQVYGQPPPGGYQTTAATVVVQPTGVTVFGNAYRDYPVHQQCPHCHQNITTRIEYQDGWIVWLSAGVICLVGGWLGCCLIPFCINSIKDVNHYCPACNNFLGKYNR
ncbi:LITAF domain-containing protein-like [Glandiceps talaboti]